MANETADDGMQCSDHPYSKNPGGICAFCLQEKLDMLLSSAAADAGGNPFSFLRPQPSFTSSSESPSFRSDYGATQKKKVAASSSSASNSYFEGFKRRKSVASRSMSRVSDAITTVDTPRKKSFWSFLRFSSPSSSSSSGDLMQHQRKENTSNDVQTKIERAEVVAEGSSSFGRKVARSRSVGCGSRSFSGDFLERISTGFGDCTLRRVESHRERNQDSSKKLSSNDMQRIKERVGCAGMFIGGGYGFNSEIGSSTVRASASATVGGRNRSWGWAFASPVGSFKPAKSSSSSSKSYASNNATASIDAATATGNGRKNGEVGANPSLLTVGR